MTNEDYQTRTQDNAVGDMNMVHDASPNNQIVTSLPVITPSRHSVRLRAKWGGGGSFRQGKWQH